MTLQKVNQENKRAQVPLSELDIKILRMLQENSRVSLEILSNKLEVPKSTIYYRIKRLEEQGVIEGYYAKINPSRVGLDFTALVQVWVKFGPRHHEKVANALAQIPGVSDILFLFGEIDYMVIVRSRDGSDHLKKMERLQNMIEIERTNTYVVAQTIRDDPRIQM